MLERYYGERVESMTLCCIHETHPFATEVPRLQLEAGYLMAVEQRRAGRCRRLRAALAAGTPAAAGEAAAEAVARAVAAGVRLLCERSGQVRTHPRRHPATGERCQLGAVLAAEGSAAGWEPDPEAEQHAAAVLALVEPAPEDEARVEKAAAELRAGRVAWREQMPKEGLEHRCLRDIGTGALRGQLRSDGADSQHSPPKRPRRSG